MTPELLSSIYSRQPPPPPRNPGLISSLEDAGYHSFSFEFSGWGWEEELAFPKAGPTLVLGSLSLGHLPLLAATPGGHDTRTPQAEPRLLSLAVSVGRGR